MNEKYLLVEHSSAINTIIHNTFQTTQRIKFTSFDVSTNYIIFGVNSGGIYIFTRETCQFIKLIPSTHGSANLLSISDDETNLAIAVPTGVIIVLEDSFTDHFQQQLFTEHEGNTVTALKWNGNDLYCGDSTGKVSVVSFKHFLTKAIFQPPVACLMHLDSPIVQLDTYHKFLLVSTLTRSLLCDTETERYRQIGKKSRDGSFGACFFDVVESAEENGAVLHTRGAFQTVSDNEELSLTETEGDVKIYCARPGARLWQANFQADVIYTLQFRPLLNKKQSDVIWWDGSPEAPLKIVRFDDGGRVGENFNFIKLYRLLKKFIVTFRDDGIYVFEPSASDLAFWRRLSNVKDVKIVNSSMYIWHKDLKVSVMSLMSVEELVLKSLLKKQYLFCGQLCKEYSDEIQSLINTSKKIHLISVLESKLDDRELLEQLSPIFRRLKDCAKTPTVEKLQNGIVTVKNYAVTLPESVEILNNEKPKKKESKDVLLEQYKISKIHKNLETPDFNNLIMSINSNEFYNLIINFEKSLEDSDLWCKEIYLKYLKNNSDLEREPLNYACSAFLKVNNNQEFACKCNFPLPKAHKNIPKYYEIGSFLMEKSTDYETFLEKIPYTQRFVLEKLENLTEIQQKLSLIIQYSDPKIIRNLSSKMPYDIWDNSVQLLIKLKSGHCLNCDQKINTEETFEWKNFGLYMIQSIKATNTLKLFKRYSNLLPKNALDSFFYQYCIFSTVSNVNNSIFNEIIDDENVKKQFETSVGGFLRKKYLCGGDYGHVVCNKVEIVSNCDHCQLPLKIPIVEDVKKLQCGHNYHLVCFLYNKSCCNICDPVL